MSLGAHDQDLHRFHRYLCAERVHHAILIVGENEALRMQLALRLGQFMLCSSRRAGALPCGKCTSCLRIQKGVHPDCWVIESTEDEIKIESVRALCRHMEVAPLEGKAKVSILDHCDRITPAGANALLKTLEEPGADRYFCLLTHHPGNLLPTLLSRCIVFQLMPTRVESEYPAEISALWEEFERSGKLAVLNPIFQDKEKPAHLVRLLQERTHAAVISEGNETETFSLFALFEGLTDLEFRFRSNVNAGLLLEDFLRRNYVTP